MRVLLTLAAMTVALLAAPTTAAEPDDATLMRRFVMDETSLANQSGSDAEKLRTARYGLSEPIDDDYEAVPDSLRVRWKLNRLKMRMPINTSSFR